LEEEITLHLNAYPHERSDNQHGYRNGHRSQQLKTDLFDRYERSEKAVVLSLAEMYLEGVSTRAVKDITEVLCGFRAVAENAPNLSKSTGATCLDISIPTWRRGGSCEWRRSPTHTW
jgi:putative transposase